MIRQVPIRLLLTLLALAPLPAHAQVTTELDALWARVSQSVATGDPNLYLSTYHPDAIFVSARRGITRTVAEDVEANRAVWNDTREGRAIRSVRVPLHGTAAQPDLGP